MSSIAKDSKAKSTNNSNKKYKSKWHTVPLLAVVFLLPFTASSSGAVEKPPQAQFVKLKKQATHICFKDKSCKYSEWKKVLIVLQDKWWKEQELDIVKHYAGLLLQLRNCESATSGLYQTNTGNGFYGAYQFDYGTWKAAGGSTEYAHLATPAEQDYRAAYWLSKGHRSAWPNC